VMLQPLRLHVRSDRTADVRPLVPLQSEPAQALVERLFRFRVVALAVRVLQTEDERAAAVPGEEPVEEGRPDRAEVGQPRWARREPDTYRTRGLVIYAGESLRHYSRSSSSSSYISRTRFGPVFFFALAARFSSKLQMPGDVGLCAKKR